MSEHGIGMNKESTICLQKWHNDIKYRIASLISLVAMPSISRAKMFQSARLVSSSAWGPTSDRPYYWYVRLVGLDTAGG